MDNIADSWVLVWCMPDYLLTKKALKIGNQNSIIIVYLVNVFLFWILKKPVIFNNAWQPS